jgi:hypothetical protein
MAAEASCPQCITDRVVAADWVAQATLAAAISVTTNLTMQGCVDRRLTSPTMTEK